MLQKIDLEPFSLKLRLGLRAAGVPEQTPAERQRNSQVVVPEIIRNMWLRPKLRDQRSFRSIYCRDRWLKSRYQTQANQQGGKNHIQQRLQHAEEEKETME